MLQVLRRSLGLTAAVGAFVAVLGGLTPSVRAQTAVDFKVDSRIRSLKVVAVQSLDRRFELTVLNTGDKIIGGFELAFPPMAATTIQEFLPPRHPGIRPGETFSRIYGVTYEGSQSPPPVTVVLSALIFVNSSTEGDPAGAAHLRQVRVGRVIQLHRIMPILDEMFGPDGEPTAAALSEVAERIERLPDVLADGKEPPYFTRIGLREVRQETVSELRSILDLQRRAPRVSVRPAVERLRDLSRNTLEVLATAPTQQ